MGMTPQVWARHSNPWSGWSRLTVLPLFALAVWSRIWLGWGALGPILLVLVWTWLNPRIFATPKRTDNWMSRGVLGEQILAAPEGCARIAAPSPCCANAYVYQRRWGAGLSSGSDPALTRPDIHRACSGDARQTLDAGSDGLDI